MCTSYDTLSELTQKYPEITHVLKQIDIIKCETQNESVKLTIDIKHSVDATDHKALEPPWPVKCWTDIIFNHPHRLVDDP